MAGFDLAAARALGVLNLGAEFGAAQLPIPQPATMGEASSSAFVERLRSAAPAQQAANRAAYRARHAVHMAKPFSATAGQHRPVLYGTDALSSTIRAAVYGVDPLAEVVEPTGATGTAPRAPMGDPGTAVSHGVSGPNSVPPAASWPAALSPPAMPAPTSPRQSAAELWSQVAADLNERSGLTVGGPRQPESGRLSFIEPRAGRSAGPMWDAVAAKLNAEGRAGATPEAPAAGGQAADLWAQTAAAINAEGRAANAGFVAPGQHHGAYNARSRIS